MAEFWLRLLLSLSTGDRYESKFDWPYHSTSPAIDFGNRMLLRI